MLIGVNPNAGAARLFALLACGEHLAEQGACRQIALTDVPQLRRFFRRQARQERMHRIMFERAAAALAPRALPRFEVDALAEFVLLLEDAFERRDFPETLLAQQVVLEGLGEVVLEAVDAGMTARRCGLEHLRRLVRAQERAHHAFGMRALNSLHDSGRVDVCALADKCAKYLAAAEQTLARIEDLFAWFDEDPAQYRRRLHEAVPAWLQPVDAQRPAA